MNDIIPESKSKGICAFCIRIIMKLYMKTCIIYIGSDSLPKYSNTFTIYVLRRLLTKMMNVNSALIGNIA